VPGQITTGQVTTMQGRVLTNRKWNEVWGTAWEMDHALTVVYPTTILPVLCSAPFNPYPSASIFHFVPSFRILHIGAAHNDFIFCHRISLLTVYAVAY